MTLYMGYFFLVSVFGVKKAREYPKAAPKTRFAILVAARNEEAVIGNLVESLVHQDYPRELYDVIVIPNNCTDDTAGAVLRAGGTVLECTVPVRSKGEVLTFAVETLLEGDKQYDDVLVFDADNVVHPRFLQEMNNAVCAGARVAQGYRDSKNPRDTLTSGASSIYYWMVDRFYSQARSNMGLNAVVNGSGILVDLELLRERGGWHTVTMTEDIEFTAQCALEGNLVYRVPQAVTFDEQPLTFGETWKQRKRWSTGMLQGLEHYAGDLFRAGIKGNFRPLDSLIFFIFPVMQLIWMVSLGLGFAFSVMNIEYGFFPQTNIYYQMFFTLNLSFLGTFFTALLAVAFNGKSIRENMGAMCWYWVYIMSWIPINCICMVRKTKSWEPIRHTRSIEAKQLFSQTQ